MQAGNSLLRSDTSGNVIPLASRCADSTGWRTAHSAGPGPSSTPQRPAHQPQSPKGKRGRSSKDRHGLGSAYCVYHTPCFSQTSNAGVSVKPSDAFALLSPTMPFGVSWHLIAHSTLACSAPSCVGDDADDGDLDPLVDPTSDTNLMDMATCRSSSSKPRTFTRSRMLRDVFRFGARPCLHMAGIFVATVALPLLRLPLPVSSSHCQLLLPRHLST